MDIELNILQNWIQESDNIVFISGADLSAEAGFPDYRIMTQADWARYKYAPDEILRLTFLQRNPFYFYRYYREKILAPVLTAQPSPAHEALAHLEQAGKLRAILTVNIDGAVGAPSVKSFWTFSTSPTAPPTSLTAMWICAGTMCARPLF